LPSGVDAERTGLVERFLRGDRLALAKTITLVENDAERGRQMLDAVYARTGSGRRIGVTGPPGAGKSTIIDGLIRLYRNQKRTVGVVAVDPTSPFTGGALLGDRVRMQSQRTDPDVFIRSMASRGSWGGLAAATADVIELLDAFGKDIVIAETVGVGQSEYDVVDATHSTVVVVVPESGDSIQVMKAGLMEIADIFVINKADRDGAREMEVGLTSMLEMRGEREGWRPPILQAVATRGEGITALIEALDEHRAYLDRENVLEGWRRRAVRARVRFLVDDARRTGFWDAEAEAALDRAAEDVLARRQTPGGAARALVSSRGRKGTHRGEDRV